MKFAVLAIASSACLQINTVTAFVCPDFSQRNIIHRSQRQRQALRSSQNDDFPSDTPSPETSSYDSRSDLDQIKSKLVAECNQSSPSTFTISTLVNELEYYSEQVGIGQGSANSGLLSGEWELLHSPEDITRASPFFWAFRKALPDQSKQIYDITDAIPAPLKEVGPAFQTIDLDASNVSSSYGSANDMGSLVSRVKVATLAGQATSIMTTRCTIVGTEGVDTIRLRVDTTKPEESTILQKLGPLGKFIDENVAQPFPSGEALEQVQVGSSEVTMKTTFCDESLRTTFYNEGTDAFVWKRKSFSAGFEI